MNQCDKVEPLDRTTWEEPNDEQLNSIIKKMIAFGETTSEPEPSRTLQRVNAMEPECTCRGGRNSGSFGP
jgi:hypothetical protein